MQGLLGTGLIILIGLLSRKISYFRHTLCLFALMNIAVYYLLHVFLFPAHFLAKNIQIGANFLSINQCFILIIFSTNPVLNFASTSVICLIALLLKGCLKKQTVAPTSDEIFMIFIVGIICWFAFFHVCLTKKTTE